MGIQLKEVMTIYPFSKARLVAGRDGVERFVESANIQEVPDVVRWLKGKEILFSSGYAFQNPEKGCDLIRKLNYIGATALVIKPGQYFDEIPEDMIECADEIGFPLFELPETLPYMDCIIPIFERITSEQLYVMKRLTQMHEELIRTLLENQGLNGICSVLHNLFQNKAYILSMQGLLLAVSEELDDTEREIINDFAEQYCNGPGYFKFQKNKCNQILMKGHWLVCIPIYIHKEYLSYLVVDMAQDQMQETDMMVCEQAGYMIAIELLKERELLLQEQTMEEQLLEDILLKRYSDEEMIVRRESYLGYNISRQYCIFMTDANSFADYILKDLQDSSEEKIQKIKQDIQETIRKKIKKNFPQVLFCSNGMELTGMMKINNINEIRQCQEVLQEMICLLEKKYKPLTFSAGIGTMKNKISQAADGLEEAKIALKTGKGMRICNHKVYYYGDLGCLCFLRELGQSQNTRAFYEKYMKPLIAYDSVNDAELVKTLECYFECNSNYRKTADKMYVHKNTVIYRIKQIESLLNISLEDWKVTFELQLCLQLHYIL